MKLETASVIIPTRGRDACLRQVLRDLDQQNFSNFDVWIIDQNDSQLIDLTESLISKKLHHEKMQPLGSHAGRNYGIQKTTADVCIFIDDDVRLEIDFVSKHMQAIQDTDVVAGKVVQPKDGLSELEMKQQGKLAKYNYFLGTVSGNFIGVQDGEVDHFHECNFSARTKILKEVNGFNENFTGNAYFEGTDLALRIKKNGYKILYHSKVQLIHLQESSGGNREQDKAKHTYWMLRNQSLLNSAHMNKLGLPFFEIYSLSYVTLKSLKNKNFNIAVSGIKGLIDGLKFFIKKGNLK